MPPAQVTAKLAQRRLRLLLQSVLHHDRPLDLTVKRKLLCLNNGEHPMGWGTIAEALEGLHDCPYCGVMAYAELGLRLAAFGVGLRGLHRADELVPLNGEQILVCLNNRRHPPWLAKPAKVMQGTHLCKACRPPRPHYTLRGIPRQAVEQALKVRNIALHDAALPDRLLSGMKYTFACLAQPSHAPWPATLNSVYHRGSGCPACGHIRKVAAMRQRMAQRRGATVH